MVLVRVNVSTIHADLLKLIKINVEVVIVDANEVLKVDIHVDVQILAQKVVDVDFESIKEDFQNALIKFYF